MIQKDKVAQLHIFRAIAAIGVVFTHAKFVLWSGGGAYIAKFPVRTWNPVEYPLFFLDLISSLGKQQLYLFFILSGFFIKYSVRSSFSLPSYLCKRLMRIYPAFLAATLLAGTSFTLHQSIYLYRLPARIQIPGSSWLSRAHSLIVAE